MARDNLRGVIIKRGKNKMKQYYKTALTICFFWVFMLIVLFISKTDFKKELANLYMMSWITQGFFMIIIEGFFKDHYEVQE